MKDADLHVCGRGDLFTRKIWMKIHFFFAIAKSDDTKNSNLVGRCSSISHNPCACFFSIFGGGESNSKIENFRKNTMRFPIPNMVFDIVLAQNLCRICLKLVWKME